MAVKYFTPNYKDVLTGTSQADRFVVGSRKDVFTLGKQRFLDSIINYANDDIIDLPGRWGTDGNGMRLSPIYRDDSDSFDYNRAEVIRRGHAGIIEGPLATSNSRTFYLVYNYKPSGFKAIYSQDSPKIYSDEDIVIRILTSDLDVGSVLII